MHKVVVSVVGTLNTGILRIFSSPIFTQVLANDKSLTNDKSPTISNKSL